ncbi:reverse transcriptase domain-containing protein [Tanacetum coccineum]
MIVYTDHSPLRHLFKNQDAKLRLIRWIMLLQEFDIEIKDKKGTENVAADHLSRIDNDEKSDDSDVDDNFSGETLMEITTNDTPWFADFANDLVGDVIPKGMMYQQKNKLISDLKNYFWEDHYLFKVCSDAQWETVAWDVYEAAILKRFGAINEDPMVELKNLKYETLMKEYHSQFEKLLNQVDITESQAISMFIGGLLASIELKVRMFISLAGLQEATLAVLKQRNVPLLPTPKTVNG